MTLGGGPKRSLLNAITKLIFSNNDYWVEAPTSTYFIPILHDINGDPSSEGPIHLKTIGTLAIVIRQMKVMPRWLHPITLFTLLCSKAECGINAGLLVPSDIEGFDPLVAQIVAQLKAFKPTDILPPSHDLRLCIELILDQMVRHFNLYSLSNTV